MTDDLEQAAAQAMARAGDLTRRGILRCGTTEMAMVLIRNNAVISRLDDYRTAREKLRRAVRGLNRRMDFVLSSESR